MPTQLTTHRSPTCSPPFGRNSDGGGPVAPAVAHRLLLVSGSLRAASTNTAVLRTARLLAPPHIEAILYDGMSGLPHFNPDDDRAALDAPVADFRAHIHAASGVLFCVPEYAGA